MSKIVLLFILFSFFFNCKNETEPYDNKLVLAKQFCEINHNGMVYIPEIKLLLNNKIIKKFEPNVLNKYSDIDSLISGNYIIEYSTIYKMKELVSVNIGNKQIDTVELCIDKINYKEIKHIPFISKLKNDEFFTIDLWTQGCASHPNKKIKIEKSDDAYFGIYDEKRKKLSENEIELLKRFELELTKIDYGNCTNTDMYTIKYNEEELKIDDESCTWYGYNRLCQNLFGI